MSKRGAGRFVAAQRGAFTRAPRVPEPVILGPVGPCEGKSLAQHGVGPVIVSPRVDVAIMLLMAIGRTPAAGR